MDISSILNDNQADPQGVSTVPTDITNDGSSSGAMDPLAGYNLDDNGKKLSFNANSTIDTSDNSSVGDYSAAKATEPIIQEVVDPLEQTQSKLPKAVDFVITDPAKMDFIKTYTKEYDDLVSTTTHAVELILASIDKTVQDHTNDIVIPEEAMSILDNKPTDNKVSKFDEAQQIVRVIMDKASEAKSQAEKAAMTAAEIYDGIQKFKEDTDQQIASIRNRDEFGRDKAEPIKTPTIQSDSTDNNLVS